jgi:hypothetical protein
MSRPEIGSRHTTLKSHQNRGGLPHPIYYFARFSIIRLNGNGGIPIFIHEGSIIFDTVDAAGLKLPAADAVGNNIRFSCVAWH